MIEFKSTEPYQCFLSTVFIDTEASTICEDSTVLQLVFSEGTCFTTHTEYATLTEAKRYMTYCRNVGLKARFDFDISDDLIISSSPYVRTHRVDKSLLHSFIDVKDSCTDFVTSIYDLFRDIIKVDGIFIHDDKLQNVIDGDTTEGVTEFVNINIAKTTMTVSMLTVVDNRWNTSRMISIEDGHLKSKPFMFAVNASDEHMITKYGLTEVERCRIWNRDVVIFKYNREIPIYMHTPETFRFIPPLLAMYASDVELYTTLQRVTSRCLAWCAEELDLHRANQTVSSESRGPSRSYNKYGLTIEPKFKALSKADINVVFNELLMALKEGRDLSDCDFVQMSVSNGFNMYGVPAYRLAYRLLSTLKLVPLDILDFAGTTLKKILKQAVDRRIYLYAFRASSYVMSANIGNCDEFYIGTGFTTNPVKIKKLYSGGND